MVAAVKTEGLTKRFGKVEALTDLSLTVSPGDCYGLLGLNGAGKTTTIRLLMGVLPPTAGSVEVQGHDPRQEPTKVRADTGVVSSLEGLGEPGWSPARYLRFFGRLRLLTPRVLEKRMRSLASILRLEPYMDSPICTLSRGTRRKVSLAQALLHQPSILFLDEPTSGLDIPSKRAVWISLRELNHQGMTVLISSHDVQEIETLCHSIGILRDGRLVWEGTKGELGRGDDLVAALAQYLEA